MFQLVDFLIYCFVNAYTPGANNLLSMSYAAKLGFRRSVRFNLGITAGFFVVMGVCVLFSSTLFSLLPKVKLVMQILGAIYLLYLAYKVLKSSGDLSEQEGEQASFHAGMLLQFMNPKIYIYAITAMSLYVLPVYQGIGMMVVFTLVLTVIGASGSYVWALCGGAMSRFLQKYSKQVNLVMAILLVYCAVSLFH